MKIKESVLNRLKEKYPEIKDENFFEKLYALAEERLKVQVTLITVEIIVGWLAIWCTLYGVFNISVWLLVAIIIASSLLVNYLIVFVYNKKIIHVIEKRNLEISQKMMADFYGKSDMSLPTDKPTDISPDDLYEVDSEIKYTKDVAIIVNGKKKVIKNGAVQHGERYDLNQKALKEVNANYKEGRKVKIEIVDYQLNDLIDQQK